MAKSKNYQFGAIKEKTLPLADGTRQLLENGYIVEFNRLRALEPWEETLARNTFEFSGENYEQDMITPIDPVRQRVSLFDTSSVPEELREQVEKRLLESDVYGSDFIRAEKPPLTPPWPAYDELKGAGVAEKVAGLVKDFGVDPESVAEYERETKNRAAVLAALKALAPSDDDIIVKA